jgi:phosphate transport system protein
MSETAPHIVKSYEQELKRLRDMITEMGGMVENQVALAAVAVVENDTASATQAVEQDPAVDALERQVEQFVIRLLALRQPMAADLRQIVAALKITHDLERIGDHATNIAETVHFAVTGEALPEARPKGDVSAYAVVRPRE